MLIRHLDELVDSDRHVRGQNWESRRLLLRNDGMGFSLHDTIIHPGTSTRMQYLNHFEAVYCIEGTGSIRVMATGEEIPLRAGSLYALDQHDDHILTATTRMRMLCVFNPALVGPETHDERGAYPLLEASTSS
jgi:L-ectoine synthase